MDIQEFITDSIRQIINASTELNSEFNEKKVKVAGGTCTGGINSSKFYHSDTIKVDFNISVTVDESLEKKGGAGLKVVSFLGASGELDSVKASQTANTIHFEIPVEMPIIR